MMKKKLVLLVLIGIFVFILALNPSQKSSQKDQIFEYYQKYSKSQKPFMKAVQDDLSDITKRVGVGGVLELIVLYDSKNNLNRSDCHGIMHLLGHQAYSSKDPGIPGLVEKYGYLCKSGFTHGIESQIGLEESDTKLRNEKLNSFCKLYVSQTSDNISCFHGVGHAFQQKFSDPSKALRECDTLSPLNGDFTSCYRGVFSQVSSEVSGIDGETGLPLPGKRRAIENPKRPLLYCLGFEEKYRTSCWFAMAIITKSGVQGDDILPCLYKEYPIIAQELCVEYLVSVSTREKLSADSSFTVPQSVGKMQESLQHAYVKGILEVVDAFAREGKIKDWKSICASMSSKLKEYCIDYGNSNLYPTALE